jgi:hypothetical protein
MKGLVKRMLRQWGYDVVPWRDGWLSERASPSAPVPLRDEHVRNCRVLANRQLMVAQLPKRGVVAELGVGLGDFSAVILEQAVPREFHAIDLFEWHDRPTVWGLPTKDVLGGRSHEEFYRARFQRQIDDGIVRVERGASWEALARRASNSFYVLYVDAGHDRDSVQRDAACALEKLKSDGLLIFNDYIMYDHVGLEPYGVVHVVNDLCVVRGYEMVYFALHEQMFCDVALRKRSGP